MSDFRMNKRLPINNSGLTAQPQQLQTKPQMSVAPLPQLHKLSNNGVRSVALVVDVPNWAFDFIARSIAKYGQKFTYNIVYFDQIKRYDFSQHDIIHFFFYAFYIEYLKTNKPLSHQHITLGIHGHHHDPKEIEVCKAVESINCVSKRLVNQFVKYRPVWCADGVDMSVFHPFRDIAPDGNIVVGFSGNSQHPINKKGLTDIIIPAVEASGLQLSLADRQLKWRTPSEMNEWYNSIDIIVCASDEEGTPLPILEAAACKRGFISTNVGIVPDFHNDSNGIVLDTRSASCLTSKLKSLTKATCRSMGEAAFNTVKLWQRQLTVARYENWWKSLLTRRFIHVVKHHAEGHKYNSIGKFSNRVSRGLKELGYESQIIVAKTVEELEQALGRKLLPSDVVLCHNWEIAPEYNTEVNVIPVVHQLCANSIRFDFDNPVHRQFTKQQSALLQQCRHAILVNPELCKFGQIIYPNTEFHFVPNSIDIASAHNTKKQLRSILWVGRLEKAKGFDSFVEAAKKLANGYTITIAGEQIEKYDLKGLKYLGMLKEEALFDQYATHQIYILPSKFESFPNTILEAGIHQCCVIVSDLPGFRTLFGDAVIYLPDTLPETICKTIRSLNTKQCEEYGSKLHKLISDKYSPKQAATALVQEITKVFGKA